MPQERMETNVPIEKKLASNRTLAAVEIALVVCFVALDYVGIIHVRSAMSRIILLLLFAWLSLWLRGMRWRDVGLQRPAQLGFTVIFALLAAIVMQVVSFKLVIPIASQLLGSEIDLSILHQFKGNWANLMIGLVWVWSITAFGEELFYRGYLLSRLADLAGGNGSLPAITALMLSSALFGFIHWYQGVVGMLDTFVFGLTAGVLYLACGRKLWLPILLHGFNNTIGLLLAFLGML